MKEIRNKDVVHVLFAEIAPAVADRQGMELAPHPRWRHPLHHRREVVKIRL